MKTKITLTAILIFIVTNCIAQTQILVSEEWAEDKGTQNFFQKSVTKTDANQNVVIAGATINSSGNYDLLLTKYDSQGNELWTQQVGGSGDDFASAIFIDASLNTYVTGTVFTDSTNYNDIIILEYDDNGNLLWDTTYNGAASGNDLGGDITVDGDGDIYVTGTSYDSTSQYNFITLKFNSSGQQQWVSIWNNVGLNDVANKISFANDGASTINVAGGTQVNTFQWKYAIVSYDVSNGNQVSYAISGGSGTGIDRVTDIARDTLGNVYVTGGVINQGTGYDCYTIKLDSLLVIQWTATFNGNDSLDDVANGVKIDSQGNVYICGFTTTSGEGKNYITIKYDASGNEQWTEIYNRPMNGNDEATALALKSDTEIVVTGTSSNGTNDDYTTIKYSDNADLIWSISYDGGMNDKAADIAIDNLGGIIVAGQSQVSGVLKYVTVKYVELSGLIPPDTIPCPSSFAFYQNRGQIIDTQDSVRRDIKYYTVHNYPDLYFFKPDADSSYRLMSYVFSRVDTDTSTTDTLHRVDLTFEQSENPIDTNSKPFSVQKSGQGYLNYYLPQCPNGITGVEGFQKLLYPDAFPNTDILFYGNNAGMKFYIELKPGADEHISMKFTGQDTLIIHADSSLEIVSSIGSYSYPHPDAFQIDSSGNRVYPSWHAYYQDFGSGNIGISMGGSYDTTLTLVIEVGPEAILPPPPPTDNLEWCMYYGGTGYDHGEDVTNDNASNMFVTGTTSSVYFPVTNGLNPFNSYHLSYDAFVLKFHNDAQQWATFYGGSGAEMQPRIAIDSRNNVYLSGRTSSTSLPQLNGTFPGGGTFTGQFDYFLVKFNPNATQVLWGDYFGHTPDFYHRQNIAVDRYNNIYIAGSADTIPITTSTGGYNQVNSAGGNEPFICKLDTGGTVLWCTHFGGSGDEWVDGIRIQKNSGSNLTLPDEVYIFGGTNSSTYSNNPCGVASNNGFPSCAPAGAYHQASFGGGNYDFYIAEFNDSFPSAAGNNQLLWSTYFGGATNDQFYPAHYGDITSLRAGNSTYLYIAGRVKGDTGTVTTFPYQSCAGCYNQSLTLSPVLGIDILIAKFIDRALNWTTFYGGIDTTWEYPYSLTATTNTLYMSGMTATQTMSGTPCQPPGNGDFPFCNVNGYYSEQNYIVSPFYHQIFLTAFDISNNSMKWSTYFGHDDAGASFVSGMNLTHISASPLLNQLYLSGFSNTYNSSDFPIRYSSYPNAWVQDTNANQIPGPVPDAIVARFNLDAIIIGIGNPPDDNYTGDILIYPNPSQNAITLEMNVRKQGRALLMIYDVLGRCVYNKGFDALQGSQKKTLDVSSYSPGIYFVKITIDNYSTSLKFAKQ